jgi:hypothetical protein
VLLLQLMLHDVVAPQSTVHAAFGSHAQLEPVHAPDVVVGFPADAGGGAPTGPTSETPWLELPLQQTRARSATAAARPECTLAPMRHTSITIRLRPAA